MTTTKIPEIEVILGDCLSKMELMSPKCFKLIFADPPYFLQHGDSLMRPEGEEYRGVTEAWDKFDSLEHYQEFTRDWLEGVHRLLDDDGTIWISGTYHNIYTVGTILMDMGFWILNEVIWAKNNPTPNFKGVRFQQSHETLIWAAKSKDSKYTFNYQALKSENNNVQERDIWNIPVCRRPERIMRDGKTVHPTQKPEELLQKIIFASSEPGDWVLDPFYGTGTTGAACLKMNRNCVGIEQEISYYNVAKDRLYVGSVQIC